MIYLGCSNKLRRWRLITTRSKRTINKLKTDKSEINCNHNAHEKFVDTYNKLNLVLCNVTCLFLYIYIIIKIYKI